ncbi:MAG: hypothetical protein IPP91_19265 [Betaproteobacteria bacterium]|nr:hypothetical protein [Betaproteobacteria bacterium]
MTREERMLSATAAACAALVFIIVAASAWLRLVAVPCPPAGCEGFTLTDAVRLAHRVAAMGVTVLALVIIALAWKAPRRWGLRIAAAILFGLVAALAVIGRRSAGAAPPEVMLANLLGGLTLLAVSVALAVAPRQPRGRIALPFAAAALLFAVSTGTGGLLVMAPPADTASLGLAHRALSWATLAGWGLLAFASAPPAGVRAATRLAAALMALQVLLALSLPAGPLARWLHNLLTSAALLPVIAAALSCRAPLRPDPAHPERLPAGS